MCGNVQVCKGRKQVSRLPSETTGAEMKQGLPDVVKLHVTSDCKDDCLWMRSDLRPRKSEATS